jgi:hypothetical protein
MGHGSSDRVLAHVLERRRMHGRLHGGGWNVQCDPDLALRMLVRG